MINLELFAYDANYFPKKNYSLKRITEAVLGFSLIKDNDIRISKWDGKLSESQQRYAARDVWASAMALQYILEHPKAHNPFGSGIAPIPSSSTEAFVNDYSCSSPDSSYNPTTALSFDDIGSPIINDQTQIRRVLQDIIHVMWRTTDFIPAAHAHKSFFCAMLRDSILLINPEDRKLVDDF